ncbi:MAG: endonuclease III [Clostridiales bacterium]|nr:endonuclease III [Candidatus Equinaster intestinalis]
MKKKEIAAAAVTLLEEKYPEARCSLEYETPFQLLVATRLSAQCTDARVNLVTPLLFGEFPTPEKMAAAPIEKIEEYIKSCGLYKTKAKSLKELSVQLCRDYGGTIPDTIEELTKLSGIGRKTANLICGDIYGKSAVVTDTHFIRIMNRLGLVKTTEPIKVEDEMRKLLPPEKSSDFCHRTVMFGREICSARNPKCQECILNKICIKRGL